MKRYKKLLIALAAVASIYIVRATGLDGGLVDAVLDAAVEAVTSEPEAAPAPAEVVPEQPAAQPALDGERADAEALDQGGR